MVNWWLICVGLSSQGDITLDNLVVSSRFDILEFVEVEVEG